MTRKLPLAEILRAKSLDDIVGQEHLFGAHGLITKIIRSKKPLSILLWGPPGVGKTSIARLYAQAFSLKFVSLSGVVSGTADIKKIIKDSEANPLFSGTTLLFMDEIHRFNKAQQDAFLPYLEDGTIILVGATTENPSFYLNSALLSRMRVLSLESLNNHALESLLKKYETSFKTLPLDAEARAYLISSSKGDGRYLLNMVENIALEQSAEILNATSLAQVLQKKPALYDRAGDQHYNLISALHKSIRSSDSDAALYWFARMLNGGEDPMFLARRLIRMASEDIGLADPQALSLAVAAQQSYHMLGSPEGDLALAQVVLYLALAPKSNAVYSSFKQALNLAEKTSHLAPPKRIVNSSTKLMADLGYAQDYVYDHDTEAGCSGSSNFPEQLRPVPLYCPVERGFEREMKKRLDYFNNLRKQYYYSNKSD